MRKINLLIELEYDDVLAYGDDEGAYEWFTNEVLLGDHLVLSDVGDIGDVVGTVRVLTPETVLRND